MTSPRSGSGKSRKNWQARSIGSARNEKNTSINHREPAGAQRNAGFSQDCSRIASPAASHGWPMVLSGPVWSDRFYGRESDGCCSAPAHGTADCFMVARGRGRTQGHPWLRSSHACRPVESDDQRVGRCALRRNAGRQFRTAEWRPALGGSSRRTTQRGSALRPLCRASRAGLFIQHGDIDRRRIGRHPLAGASLFSNYRCGDFIA